MSGREHKPYPIVIRDLEVLDAYDVTPLMRRVVLTGDQLGAFRNNGYQIGPFVTENADDHVKVVVLGPDAPTVVAPAQNDGFLDWLPETIGRARDYTPRRHDATARRLELDFVRHVGGLAAEWADRVKPGDRALVAGPRGTTVLPPGIDWYFLVGDETALPAIARRIEELPSGTPVTAVVSVASASEEQTLDHRADLHLTWVHRDTAGPDALMDAVRSAPWRDGQVYAWQQAKRACCVPSGAGSSATSRSHAAASTSPVTGGPGTPSCRRPRSCTACRTPSTSPFLTRRARRSPSTSRST